MSCSILICDDYPAYRFTLAALLSTDDRFELVGEATNGREAIDVCGELRPDVLLLDIAMPEMDGLAALPLVRAASPRTRVLMHSAFVESAVAERASSLGADGYVEKGTDIRRVFASLARACAASSGAL
jgi:DNA-binding NarL/FixJ family response regulator